MKDNFFMDISNTKPFLKMAFEGFAGTGKTYTTAVVARGLHQRIGSDKPIVIFDTERAAKFLKKIFSDAGIKVLVKESRTLADLKTTMEFCREGGADILIIDSISHVWENTLESFKAKYNRKSLQFQDWGVLKPLWKSEFSEPFVSDPYHVIMCGRAGYEYSTDVNPETMKKEIYKSGVKMKVEGETAYEPDLLVLMERFEEVLGKDKSVWREATVLKDRSGMIDGKTLRNPTYESFAPAVEEMLADPSDTKPADETSSTHLFKAEDDKGEYKRLIAITLEKIEAELVKAFPSRGGEDKVAKIKALEAAFNTSSWKEVENMPLDNLEAGLLKVRGFIESVANNGLDAAIND